MFHVLFSIGNLLWYIYLFFYGSKYDIPIPVSASYEYLLLVTVRHDLRLHL